MLVLLFFPTLAAEIMAVSKWSRSADDCLTVMFYHLLCKYQVVRILFSIDMENLVLVKFYCFFQNFSIIFNFMILQSKLIVKFFTILNFAVQFSWFTALSVPKVPGCIREVVQGR